VVKTLRKRFNEKSDELAEEKEYQKVKWLKNHGELTGEEGKNPGDESSGNEASST
jgi:hypothetical protein